MAAALSRFGRAARPAAALQAADEGRAASLLIHGGAAVGESALLKDTETASRHRMLTLGLRSRPRSCSRPCTGSTAGPGHETVLPAPQARALQVAFGEWDGDHIDPFVVSLTTLSLLTELAESRPVLCLVDDARSSEL